MIFGATFLHCVYWNLKANSNLETIVSDCIYENNVDVAIFSEYSGIDFSKLNFLLSNQYKLLESFGGCETVRVLYKNSIRLSLVREQHRYLLTKLIENDKTYLLIGVHLPSNTFGDKSSDRKKIIRKIVSDIVECEQNGIHSSLIIGDMNANPFDNEMIGKDDTYRRFYNPIIDYLSEINHHYGSFYYNSGNNCLYWYCCYDQLLVRKNLIDSIKNFQYLKTIKNLNLMGTTKPDARISDHLPLLVNIKI